MPKEIISLNNFGLPRARVDEIYIKYYDWQALAPGLSEAQQWQAWSPSRGRLTLPRRWQN